WRAPRSPPWSCATTGASTCASRRTGPLTSSTSIPTAICRMHPADSPAPVAPPVSGTMNWSGASWTSLSRDAPMRIRSLLPSDRAQLIDIVSQGAGFRSAEIECAIELLDAALAPAERDENDGYEARAAVTDESGPDERVLGYACFGATPMTEATFDLYWLVVAEAARGQGIGAGLMAGLEAELKQRGGRIIRVETSSLEGQGGARRFYEKTGFRLAGSIPAFYREGDDLLVFAKVL